MQNNYLTPLRNLRNGQEYPNTIAKKQSSISRNLQPPQQTQQRTDENHQRVAAQKLHLNQALCQHVFHIEY